MLEHASLVSFLHLFALADSTRPANLGRCHLPAASVLANVHLVVLVESLEEDVGIFDSHKACAGGVEVHCYFYIEFRMLRRSKFGDCK